MKPDPAIQETLRQLRKSSSDPSTFHPSASATPWIEWLESLEQERRDITAFSCEISEEFTQHSRDLETIVDTIETLKATCAALTAILGDQDQLAPERLTSELFQKSDHVIRASSIHLREAHEMISQLRVLVHEIENKHQSLSSQILSSTASSNSSAPASLPLETLASLLSHIETSLRQTQTELESVNQSSKQLKEEFDQTILENLGQDSPPSDLKRTCLKSLNRSLENSHRLILEIAQSSENLTHRIFRIMVSIQTQDMASQKLEHICQAIVAIANRLETITSETAPASLYFAKEASKIQINQFGHLFSELENATSEIRTESLNTETEIETIASLATELGESSHEMELLVGCSEAITHVLAFVEAFLSKNHSALASLVPLHQQVSSSSLQISSELKSIATDELRPQTRSLSVSLVSLATKFSHLETALTRFAREAEKELGDLAKHSSQARDELSLLESSIPLHIATIQTTRDSVTQQAHTFSQTLSIDDRLKDKARKILEVFDSIASLQIDSLPDTLLLEEDARIESLKSNYTMQSEKQTHDQTFDSTTKLASQSSDTSNDDFEDNIELF